MVSNDERLKSILELERQFAEIDKVTEELERLSLRIEELKKDTKGDDDEVFKEDLDELARFERQFEQLTIHKNKVLSERDEFFIEKKRKHDELVKGAISLKKKY